MEYGGSITDTDVLMLIHTTLYLLFNSIHRSLSIHSTIIKIIAV